MIRETAPAKINLALHVRRRRADGYHELETLFAFAEDGDVVTVERAEANRLTITGPFAAPLLAPPMCSREGGNPGSSRATTVGVPDPGLRPSPEHEGGEAAWGGNLVTAAADAFTAAFAPAARHAITLDKHLPIASGIGGGSADAAATLRALARLHGVDPREPRLFAIAAALGADVPACLDGRTTLGTGRGDALTPIDGLPGTPLLLVNPNVAVSTGAIFAAWDGIDRGGIAEGDLLARARAGRNDLEPPARTLAPAIGDVLAMLGAADGVILARMSGSGATCFALFDDVDRRATAAASARLRGWWCLETRLG